MMSSSIEFSPNEVVVTAGASGIGRFIATSFAQLGARVHVIDIDSDAIELMARDYPELHFLQADVADEASVENLFSTHLDNLNIDVMVNCAGIAGPTAAVEDLEFEDWHRCIAVNLDATMLFSRKVIPMMKSSKSGRIINISSTAGWHGYPLRSAYAAAKWGVIGFTKSLAMELGQYNITANVICPGSVDGDRMDRVIAAEAKEKGVSETEIRANYTKGCSLRTFISGQDIANMAVFLASAGASRVTGQIMNVDGHLEYFGGMD